jgi:5'-nucleotidase
MRILITNDDGINSFGLHMLVKEIERSHEVIVVAPDNQRSASGHSITINRPLIVKEVKLEGIKSRAYKVDGTPADCVKMGVEKLMEKRVDMVISGINRGLNIATDVVYSGTVSAAIEGAIFKIPSMAVSLDVTDDGEAYRRASLYARKVLETSYENLIGKDIVLNVNVPLTGETEPKGIKVCQLGNRIYNNYYIETLTESNETGFRLEGAPGECTGENTDVFFINQGYVTVTPLHFDLTNYGIMKEVETWF